MKQSKLVSAMIMLSFAAPIFTVQANNNTETNDQLRTELQQIQQRIAMHEAKDSESSVLSDTQFNFYGSLRTTFSLNHTN
jgi:outer membrane protein OmpU